MPQKFNTWLTAVKGCVCIDCALFGNEHVLCGADVKREEASSMQPRFRM